MSVATPGLGILSDTSVDDAEQEALASLRGTYRSDGIRLRPAVPADAWQIENIYWRHWMSLHTGVPAGRFQPPFREVEIVIQWDDEMWRLRQPLMDELRVLCANGFGSVAERDGEILGFLLAESPHWGVLEGAHLYVVPSARNIGIAADLLGRTQEMVAANGLLTFIGANSPHYVEGKSLAVARTYLELEATGWRVTPHLDSAVFEFARPRVRSRRQNFGKRPEPRYSRNLCWRATRLDMAGEGDAYYISAMSAAIPGVQELSERQVRTLLHQGPAFIVEGKDTYGYALSKMAVPGVVEIVALALNSTASSGEVEAQMLEFLHKRGRRLNQDVMMLVDSGGPMPLYTPTFGPVLKAMGYIPHFSLGHDDCIPVLARAIWHDDPAKRRQPKRFDLESEATDRLRDPYWGGPRGFTYLDDPGEARGRNPAKVGFEGAERLSLQSLNRSTVGSEPPVVLPVEAPRVMSL